MFQDCRSIVAMNLPSTPQLTVIVSDVNDNAPVCPTLPDKQLDRSAQPGQLVDTLEVSKSLPACVYELDWAVPRIFT